jgi:hypothetical protein
LGRAKSFVFKQEYVESRSDSREIPGFCWDKAKELGGRYAPKGRKEKPSHEARKKSFEACEG